MKHVRKLSKVISGGQTGADQGGLLAAHVLGLVTGGHCPLNYKTDTGNNFLLSAFGLEPYGTYRSRTVLNIKNSDTTLIVALDMASVGTKLTVDECRRLGRPIVRVPISQEQVDQYEEEGSFDFNCSEKVEELASHQPATLNVAGNRERLPGFGFTRLTKYVVGRLLRELDAMGQVQRDSDL